MRRIRNKYLFFGIPHYREPHRNSEHKWEDNIKMDVKYVGTEVVMWTNWLMFGTSGGL
jgi:hypothetical protein